MEIGLNCSDKRISDRWKYLPKLNKVYTKLAGFIPNVGTININKSHIILDQVIRSEKVLKNDEQKKTFLQQIIRPRSENK